MQRRSWTRMRRLAGAAAIVGLGLLAAPAVRAQSAQPNPEVRVTTNMGSFVIELRPRRAPLTVANFLHYVREGFYTNTLFHRVVSNFIIQGGGHEASPPYALKPTGPPVVNESGNGLENKRGTVGLARAVGPDTGNCQFYINLVDNPELDPLPTRWGYTVFGKVIQGMSVVDNIGEVATGQFGPFKRNAPLKPVVIKSIEVIRPPELGTPPSAPAGTAQPEAGTPPAKGTASPGTPPPPKSSSPAAPGSTGSGSTGSGSTGSGSTGSGTTGSGSAASAPAGTQAAAESAATPHQAAGGSNSGA